MSVVGKEIKVLDHGFIRVVDVMGNDSSIVQAARVSYGDGTKTKSEDEDLINYLMKHRHTSPFEMCEIKFHIKLPIFIARQWVRHRTANINEVSARYSVLPEEYYIPKMENIAPQSNVNKQCRSGSLSPVHSACAQDLMKSSASLSYENYKTLLGEEDEGVARELARIVLPVNMYTEWYWKIDLHNLLHFVNLRMHKHAQFEIQQYAKALGEIISEWCPMTYSAFLEHVVGAVTLSRSQKEYLKSLLANETPIKVLSKRELDELKECFSV